jgi:hypothetical protein
MCGDGATGGLVAELSGEAGLKGRGGGRLLSPGRRRCAVEHAPEEHAMSERHACRSLGQRRATQRYLESQREDERCVHAGHH